MIAGTLGANGNMEPTAAMNLKPHKSPCLMPASGQGNMFNFLPDELVVKMCGYMDSYSLLKFGR